MKHGKKRLALLLALVMVLSLTVTAFAEGNPGSITVDNPQAGQTYTAYKIFDVTYDTKEVDGETVTGDHYAYTIDSTSEWFSTVNAYAETANSGLTLTQVTDTTTYIVATTNEFSSPAFAKTLKANVEGKHGDALEDATVDGKAVKQKTGLALGYYFVASNNGALCNLTTTNPAVTIHDKNEIVFEKTDDQESVEVGEKVTYTITGKVPDTTGFETYTYKITDTMTSGLSYNKDVVVKIDGTDVTNACTLTNKPNDDAATGFELTIPVKDYQEKFGKTITVTYTATVNQNAVTKVEKNRATLTYSNDPTDTSSFETTSPEEETVYSAKIVIDKYAKQDELVDGEEDTSKKLAGATFVLYRYALPTTTEGVTTYSFVKEGGSAYTATDAETNENLVKVYYKADYDTSTPAKLTDVSWYQLQTGETLQTVLTASSITSVTTDTNGAANFDGLENGTYYLEEVKAPDGYNLLDESVKVEINPARNSDTDKLTDTEESKIAEALTATANIGNNTGLELPDTGGMGTTLFYILGGILVVCAGVLLVTKRRMEAK